MVSSNKKQLMHISVLFLFTVSLASAMDNIETNSITNRKNTVRVATANKYAILKSSKRKTQFQNRKMRKPSIPPFLLDGHSARVMQKIYLPDVMRRINSIDHDFFMQIGKNMGKISAERLLRHSAQTLFRPLPISSHISLDRLNSVEKYINPYQMREEVPEAAGILLWSVYNGVPVVLLGERNDGEGWCSMGGSCDPSDVFPYVTAARETMEETMKFYSFPPELVAYMPYHDTKLSESGTCFRTYVSSCMMIPESKLNEMLENAQGTSREYNQFKWVPIIDLIQIANDKIRSMTTTTTSSSFSSSLSSTALSLTSDFAETLMQSPILNILFNIVEKNTAKKDESVNTFLSKKKEIMESCPETPSTTDQTPISFDLFDNIAYQTIQKQKKSIQESAASERSQEIDDKNRPGSASSSAATTTPSWASAPSRAFLRLILGKKAYVEGDDVKNLRTFLELFYPTLKNGRASTATKKEGSSVERESLLTEREDFLSDEESILSEEESVLSEKEEAAKQESYEKGIRVLADFLKFEEQEYKKGNLVGYHGLKGEFLFFYKYISALNSILTGRNITNSSLSLRNNQMAFINPQTGKPFTSMHEVFSQHAKNGKENDCHYGNEHETLVLFVNNLLPLGPVYPSAGDDLKLKDFSDSSTSSIHLFFGNRSFGFSSFQNWTMETLIMLGMSPAYAEQCANELNAAYAQFFKMQKNNGAMIAVSVPQFLDTTHTLLGNINDGRDSSGKSVFEMYNGVIEECRKNEEKLGNFLERSPAEQERIRKLTVEGRIYLDPMQNFNIMSNWHYPLSTKKQNFLNTTLNNLASIHALRLLRSNSHGMDNVFITQDTSRLLQNQFQHDYGIRMSRPLSLSPIDPSIFGYLISHDFRDVAVELLKTNQVKIDISDETFHNNFLKSLLWDDHYNLIGWLENLKAYIPNFDWNTIITDEDRRYAIACFLDDPLNFYSRVFKIQNEQPDITSEDIQALLRLFGNSLAEDLKKSFDLRSMIESGLQKELEHHDDELSPDVETAIRMLHTKELETMSPAEQFEFIEGEFKKYLPESQFWKNVFKSEDMLKTEEIAEGGKRKEEEEEEEEEQLGYDEEIENLFNQFWSVESQKAQTDFLLNLHSSSPEQFNKLIKYPNIDLLYVIISQDSGLKLLDIPGVQKEIKRRIYRSFGYFLRCMAGHKESVYQLAEKIFGSFQELFQQVMNKNSRYVSDSLVNFILEKSDNKALIEDTINNTPGIWEKIKEGLLSYPLPLVKALSASKLSENVQYLLKNTFESEDKFYQIVKERSWEYHLIEILLESQNEKLKKIIFDDPQVLKKLKNYEIARGILEGKLEEQPHFATEEASDAKSDEGDFGSSSSSSSSAAAAFPPHQEQSFEQQRTKILISKLFGSEEEYKQQREIYKKIYKKSNQFLREKCDNQGSEESVKALRDLHESNEAEFKDMIRINTNFLSSVVSLASSDLVFFNSLVSDSEIRTEISEYIKVNSRSIIINDDQRGFAQKLYEILGHEEFSKIFKEESELAKQLFFALFYKENTESCAEQEVSNQDKGKLSWINEVIKDSDLIQYIRATILQFPQKYGYMMNSVSNSALFKAILGNTEAEFVKILKSSPSSASQILLSLIPTSETSCSERADYVEAALEDPEIWESFKNYIKALKQETFQWTTITMLIEKFRDKSRDEFYDLLQSQNETARQVINRVVSSKDSALISKIFDKDKDFWAKIHPFENAERLITFLENVADTLDDIGPDSSSMNAVKEFLKTNILNSKIGTLEMTFKSWLLKNYALDPSKCDREFFEWLEII